MGVKPMSTRIAGYFPFSVALSQIKIGKTHVGFEITNKF